MPRKRNWEEEARAGALVEEDFDQNLHPLQVALDEAKREEEARLLKEKEEKERLKKEAKQREKDSRRKKKNEKSSGLESVTGALHVFIDFQKNLDFAI